MSLETSPGASRGHHCGTIRLPDGVRSIRVPARIRAELFRKVVLPDSGRNTDGFPTLRCRALITPATARCGLAAIPPVSHGATVEMRPPRPARNDHVGNWVHASVSSQPVHSAFRRSAAGSHLLASLNLRGNLGLHCLSPYGVPGRRLIRSLPAVLDALVQLSLQLAGNTPIVRMRRQVVPKPGDGNKYPGSGRAYAGVIKSGSRASSLRR